jgi:hypothetical protein
MKRRLSGQWLWLGLVIAIGWPLLAGGTLLQAQSVSGQAPGGKFSAAALQIEPVKSDDVAMSPEFRIAIYENLVAEVRKAGGFQHVYRSGDRRAANAPDLVILRTTVEGFKRGSEKERQVTTVAGATVIKTDVLLVSRNGHTLINRKVEGKVRLFGGNLNATRDLAKKVAKIIRQTADGHTMDRPGT